MKSAFAASISKAANGTRISFSFPMNPLLLHMASTAVQGAASGSTSGGQGDGSEGKKRDSSSQHNNYLHEQRRQKRLAKNRLTAAASRYIGYPLKTSFLLCGPLLPREGHCKGVAFLTSCLAC